MSNDSIKQDQINKAVWNACDTFRGTVDPSIYKDYVLTMLFVKYLSDVYQDHYDNYVAEYGDTPELIEELMKNERFVLPRDSGFYALYDQRHEPGNGERPRRPQRNHARHAVREHAAKTTGGRDPCGGGWWGFKRGVSLNGCPQASHKVCQARGNQ